MARNCIRNLSNTLQIRIQRLVIVLYRLPVTNDKALIHVWF